MLYERAGGDEFQSNYLEITPIESKI